MLIIAYPVDEDFLHSPLVQRAQHITKFRQMYDLLEAVFADRRVILAMTHDPTWQPGALEWSAGTACADEWLFGRQMLVLCQQSVDSHLTPSQTRAP